MDRSLNARYITLQVFYWISMCSAFPFFSLLYAQYGFSRITIGMISTAISATMMVIQPVLGALCDKFETIRKVVLPMLVVGCLAMLFLPFGNGRVLMTALVVIVLNICICPLMGIFDGWGARLKGDGRDLNYGFCRSFGSMSYAIGSATFGLLYSITGLLTMVPIFAVFALLTIWPVSTLPEPKTTAVKVRILDTAKVLIKNRRYLGYVCSNFFVFIGTNAFFTYYSLFIQELGGGSGEYGIALFVMAMSEVPIMLLSGKLLRRFRSSTMLTVAYFFHVVRIFAVSLAPSVPYAVITLAFQSVSFGLMTVSMIAYLPTIVDRRILLSSQSIGASISGLGGMLGSMLGGILSETLGIRMMFSIVSIFPLIALIIFAVTYRMFYNDPTHISDGV